MKIGSTVEFGAVRVTAVEAYARRGFHIRGEGCGFVIEVADNRIYFSGDTAGIEEMRGLGKVDTAILSICDNIYAIDPDESVEAIRGLKPGLFIPVHFTPEDEPDPVPVKGMISTKDPRFFTRKEDPARLAKALEGTGIKVALLRKLGRQFTEG